jgi:nucleoside 2-deoxyribosyltransferase
MKTFDEHIADIEKLDEFRRKARTLRQEAIEALTAHVYVPVSRSDGTSVDDRPGWAPPGDDVEKAEVLRALAMLKPNENGSDDRRKASQSNIIGDLASIKLVDLKKPLPISPGPKPLDSVPIFRCALILQALAETPGFALSETALVCFYRIVQELHEVTAPDWMSGAARADEGSRATAFITGECARALIALETALLQTSYAVKLLGEEAAREKLFANEIATWQSKENELRRCSLKISLAALPRAIVPLVVSDHQKHGYALPLLERIIGVLGRKLDVTSLQIPEGQIPSSTTPRANRLNLAYSLEIAKSIAWNSVDQFLAALRIEPNDETFKIKDNSDLEKLSEDIADKLEAAAQIVRGILGPTEKFAEFVIDREIASSQAKDLVDGAELVFAANLLGLVAGWNRPKVRAAFDILYPLLSTNGRLLSIRPFDVGDKGYRLNVATLDITRRLADLVANIDVEPEPEFLARLMLPFENTRVAGAGRQKCGWTTDPQPREPKSLWWLTALALDALDSVVRMLDATINLRVLHNFQVRRPDPSKLKLEGLFYPDYGLATYGLAKSPDVTSVAVTLQKLRAHAGHGPAEEKPLYSSILFGPPGTGKTTLVEAVANTAGVPLVEITPSDILVGGAEGIERRARQVFQALSKLTHVVILFDEFDSILLDRAKRDPEIIPTSIIEFLTPGMLPKLKALNEASKEGRVSYMLATNFIDRLDPAVTRGGRFDSKHGIYPPDVVSRLGRLLDQLKRLKASDDRATAVLIVDRDNETDPGSKQLIEDKLNKLRGRAVDLEKQRARILEVVTTTRRGPMDKLGRPGWFSMPLDDKDFEKKPFGYVLMNEKKLSQIQPEAILQREADKYNEQRAKKAGKKVGELPALTDQYWTEWKHIEDWDDAFETSVDKNTGWTQISAIIDDTMKKPPHLKIYLAGPEVFLPDAASVAGQKIKLCDAYNFIGISPVDNEIDLSDLSKHEKALRIATANEDAIRSCDLVIANLTPFRGPSADVGTAYEIGFARTLGRPVFAYTNVSGSLLERIKKEPGAGVKPGTTDEFEDSDHMTIENLDGFDNLMLTGAIDGGAPVTNNNVPRDRRYSDLAGFEQCLELAAKKFGVKKKA